MKRKAAKPGASRMRKAILETARDMKASGVMDDATFRKITLRDESDESSPNLQPVSAAEIRAFRKAAHVSQAVFARHMGVTTGHFSKLERGTIAPVGPALALLNIVRNNGVEVLLP